MLSELSVADGDRDRPAVAVRVRLDVDVAVLGVDEVQAPAAVEGRVRVDPVDDRPRQHERLEGRARLALGLGGQVELVLLAEGLARGHRADVALLRVDHHHGRRRVVVVVEVLLDGRRAPRVCSSGSMVV